MFCRYVLFAAVSHFLMLDFMHGSSVIIHLNQSLYGNGIHSMKLSTWADLTHMPVRSKPLTLPIIPTTLSGFINSRECFLFT